MTSSRTRCHYEVLGLSKDCDAAGIKKAYRKQALRWHPDKNPGDADAEAKFREVAAAYEVLSDPEKRRTYDRYGHDGEPGSSSGYHEPSMSFRHANDIFNMFFGGGMFGDDFFSMGGTRRSHGHRSGSGHRHRHTQSDIAHRSPFAMMEQMMSGGGMFGSFGGFDDFGGGGFGDFGGGFASSSMSSISGGGGGGVSRSVSTSTTIRNGKRVTRKTTTVRHADGSVETNTEETEDTWPTAGRGHRHHLDNGFASSDWRIGY